MNMCRKSFLTIQRYTACVSNELCKENVAYSLLSAIVSCVGGSCLKGCFMKNLFSSKAFIVIAAVFITLIIVVYVVVACMNLSGSKNQDSCLEDGLFKEYVGTEHMLTGWCLGNSLDTIVYKSGESVSYYETAWGNPVTTKEMIDTVKQSGFDAVRIPVTWNDHLDVNGTIDQAWLDRVEEVVNYVLDNDMICILNVHHDTGETAWIKADSSSLEKTKKGVASLWRQIAERFRDYDQKLIFEGLNELLNNRNQWTDAPYDDYIAVNELNSTFVQTVRSTGGENQNRYLIVNTYAGSTDVRALAMFVLPADTADNRLIAEVHFYYSNTKSTDDMVKRVKSRFVDNNIPVIVGEYGMKGDPADSNSVIERRNNTRYFVTKCRKVGVLGCFCWDDGGTFTDASGINNYAMLNRNRCQWYDQALVDAIVSSSGN